jgi:DNA-binding CsgD family transcriptional regulator
MLATPESPRLDVGDRLRLISAMEALAGRNPCWTLAASSLEWLLLASPATLALFYTVDGRLDKFTGDVIVARAGRDAGADLREVLLGYARRYHEVDPFAPRRLGADESSVIESSALPDWEVRSRSPYFTGFLGPLGMAGQTTILIRTDGRITAGIDLLRPAGVGIGAEQLVLLRSSQSLIEHAYGCALRLPPETSPRRLASVSLTPREAEVVRLVAGGASNREAAKALMVSEATVKTHLMHAFAKLQVRTRGQLISLLANERGTPLKIA